MRCIVYTSYTFVSYHRWVWRLCLFTPLTTFTTSVRNFWYHMTLVYEYIDSRFQMHFFKFHNNTEIRNGSILGNIMVTSSNGNIFRITGHLCGEFTGRRWISRTKASDAEFDVFFDLHLNKWLSNQWGGWWFETPSRPLWHHCTVLPNCVLCMIWRLLSIPLIPFLISKSLISCYINNLIQHKTLPSTSIPFIIPPA